jgi:anti-sigma regulatory factor (Ser/Thr protein kinase)
MNKTESVPEVIARLFAARTYITSSEVAAAAGVTRQAAHYHLRRMVESGLLIAEGARRSSRYRHKAQHSSSYALEGLSENEVWGNERSALRQIDPDILDTPNLVQILNFAFTEMVNNAIDHSRGSTVDVRWFLGHEQVAFEIEDDGVGAFASIRQSRGLADDFQAVGELSKGKQTTDPAHHSGLGIYFTSRMVGHFAISANQLVWTVNNEIDDFAIGWLDKPRTGTLVRCEIGRDTPITPKDVYAGLSDPVSSRFNKTTIHVALFREGDFVSRTEAKLIGARLEGFEVVELDFTGIDQIGQGFADELFRVWVSEHPTSRLVPVKANPAVMAMIAAVQS